MPNKNIRQSLTIFTSHVIYRRTITILSVHAWLPGVLCGTDGCWGRGGAAEGCAANGDAVLTEDTACEIDHYSVNQTVLDNYLQ